MKSRYSLREKMVISGLVQHPDLPARLLSEEIGVNPSTIGTIKKRLKDNDIIGTSYLPNFRGLGFELITIMQGTYRYPPLLKEESARTETAILGGVPSTIYSLNTASDWLLISIHRNITQARDEYNNLLAELAPWIDKSKATMTPVSLMRANVYSFFNYSPLLHDCFNIPASETPTPPTGKIKLSEMEQIYCYTRVKEPEAPDIALAKIMGISRNRERNIRDIVSQKKALEKRTTLALDRIGYSGIMFMELKLLNKATPKINNILAKHSKELPYFVFIAEDEHVIMLLGVGGDTSQKITAFIRNLKLSDIQVESRSTLFQFSEILTMSEHQYSQLLLETKPLLTNIGIKIRTILNTRAGDIGNVLLAQYLRENNKQITDLNGKDAKRFCEASYAKLESLLGKEGAETTIKDIMDNAS